MRQYATVINKGCAARFSFAAAVFGESLEACFWLQLPLALKHLFNMLANKPLRKAPLKLPSILAEDKPLLTRTLSKGRSVGGSTNLVVIFWFFTCFEHKCVIPFQFIITFATPYKYRCSVVRMMVNLR